MQQLLAFHHHQAQCNAIIPTKIIQFLNLFNFFTPPPSAPSLQLGSTPFNEDISNLGQALPPWLYANIFPNLKPRARAISIKYKRIYDRQKLRKTPKWTPHKNPIMTQPANSFPSIEISGKINTDQTGHFPITSGRATCIFCSCMMMIQMQF